MKIEDPHVRVKRRSRRRDGGALGEELRGIVAAVTVPGLARDLLGGAVDRAMKPFPAVAPPGETSLGRVLRLGLGAVGVMALPMQLLQAGFAAATAELGQAIELPAATIVTGHLGSLHMHAHPPMTMLPSFGMVTSGCTSVAIRGAPAARAGDIGLAFTCCTLSPVFQVYTGSSKVFIGGARAARVFDVTKHCQAPTPVQFGWAEVAPRLQKFVQGAAGVVLSGEQAEASRRNAARHEAAARASESLEAAAESAAQATSAAAASAGSTLQMGLRMAQLAADSLKTVMLATMGLDPGTPPCLGVLVGGGSDVVIGGFPMPPLTTTLGGLFKLSKGLVGRMREPLAARRLAAWVRGQVPDPARARTAIERAACFVVGHPVEVITGRVWTDSLDFALPGPIPLRFVRNYDSAWSERPSPLGFGWSHSLDQALWAEPGQLVIRAEDGRELEIALPEGAEAATVTVFDRLHRVTVRGLGGGRWRVRGADGLVRSFAPVAGDAGAAARLVEIGDPSGAAIRLEYDERGRLAWVRDSGGRRIRFVHDADGRLVQILLPHPDCEGLIGHVEFGYDESGDLVRAVDALGHAAEFAYEEHRLIRETLRGGLSFGFEYEGRGAEARCVRTWGDGGIHEQRLVYDVARRTTVVTNSCGETTVYRAGASGAVIEVVDPRGGVHRREYDAFLRRTGEIDPLGRVTRYSYDDRGNRTGVVGPGGATIAVVYDAEDRPIAATDALGGAWRWTYDERGRLAACVDPRGDTTVVLESGEETGRALRIGRGSAGEVVWVELPGGGRIARRCDRRGRVREVVDVAGATRRFDYDLLDRVVRITEADGVARSYEYDAAGELVRIHGGGRDVTMTYDGFGRIASRSEGGQTVRFSHDTEGRLCAVTDALGAVYRFERDCAGDVAAEIGFDGVRRLYTRDAAGQVVTAHRPGGLVTSYEYDPTGAIVAVAHSDGSGDRFVYRADGALIEARRREPGAPEVVVRIERDPRGRAIREWQGEHWVERRYGQDGLRTAVHTSLGAAQTIVRDAAGDVARIEADGWAAEFVRDARGLELERRLPGGLRATWRRDALGRPVAHSLVAPPRARLDTDTAAGPSRVLREVGWSWDEDGRLARIEDGSGASIALEHDARGFLVAMGGARRVPDAAGNLYRCADRSDRVYGPGGRLLAADGDTYAYDREGNRVGKTTKDGAQWRYRWSASGTLIAVERPDGAVVRFAYDALGRRVRREVGGRTTRWVWDGDVPVHEWTVEATEGDAPGHVRAGVGLLGARRGESAEEVVTWVFEPGGFVPLARLSSRERRGASVVADAVGAPVAMFDAQGEWVWSAALDGFGAVAQGSGERGRCPFRWPGQSEDAETGLHDNRFRPYDPAVGVYLSQDPLGLLAGTRLYGYVRDPSRATDVFGLAQDCGPSRPGAGGAAQLPGVQLGVGAVSPASPAGVIAGFTAPRSAQAILQATAFQVPPTLAQGLRGEASAGEEDDEGFAGPLRRGWAR